ncbi:MAG: tandem-95 repeat protein [Rhodopirellula sp.]|nr:tandem-95 repeat protein [Rhodopirellula sp.]
MNDAPVAVSDSYSVAEDGTLTATDADGTTTASDATDDGVLANDADGNDTLANVLSAVLAAAPAHGSMALTANGTFTYTPDANFHGQDSFSYQIVDDNGTAGDASDDVFGNVVNVSITVTPVDDDPTAANVTLITNEDTPENGQIPASDVDGDTLTYSIAGTASNGTINLNTETGKFIYTPAANYSGVDSFTVSVSDGAGTVATSTVSVTVNSVNDEPVAVSDAATTTEDNAVSGNVLTNDTDPNDTIDTDTINAVLVSEPAHGSLTFDGTTGAFTYTPDADFHGSDSFSQGVCQLI